MRIQRKNEAGVFECLKRGLREPFKGKQLDFISEGSKFRMPVEVKKAMLARGLVPTSLVSAENSALVLKENLWA